MKHVVVYYEKGMFGGWPANGGVWSWGDEILVSFNVGKYLFDPNSHSIDRDTIKLGFGRSLDGGKSWTTNTLDSVYDTELKPVPPDGHDFSHPDFALRVGVPGVDIHGRTYILSYDRGHTWEGPYEFAGVDGELTNRTCYLVEGSKSLRIFMSETVGIPGEFGESDRAFTAITKDGGQIWSRLGDMTSDKYRSVMPDVVRLSDDTLVAALRRKDTEYLCSVDEAVALREKGEKPPRRTDNWIGIARSSDNGATWSGEVRAAETAAGRASANGNPPAMRRLADGRLVLVYGYRGIEPSIRVKVSKDDGLNWSMPMILRDNPGHDHPRSADIGYPRLAVRPDGKLVAIYYYMNEEMPEQHIEATVFEV